MEIFLYGLKKNIYVNIKKFMDCLDVTKFQ